VPCVLTRPGPDQTAGLACGSISHMTELTDVSGAFGYGDSILAGERVRLRGVRDDDLAALAKWEMDPGRMATLSNWVAPPSEAAAKERIAKWSANEKDDIGFAIETLDDPPVLVGNIGLWGAPQGPVCDARDRPRP
jgi:RimJ/RimL family protein N-acetyltransferase